MFSNLLIEGSTKFLYGDNNYNIKSKEKFNYAIDLKAISYFSGLTLR